MGKAKALFLSRFAFAQKTDLPPAARESLLSFLPKFFFDREKF